MPNTHIDRIFGVLESAGYPRDFQHSLLPHWVTSEVLQDEGATLEVAAILAKRLGLRVAPSLLITQALKSFADEIRSTSARSLTNPRISMLRHHLLCS